MPSRSGTGKRAAGEPVHLGSFVAGGTPIHVVADPTLLFNDLLPAVRQRQALKKFFRESLGDPLRKARTRLRDATWAVNRGIQGEALRKRLEGATAALGKLLQVVKPDYLVEAGSPYLETTAIDDLRFHKGALARSASHGDGVDRSVIISWLKGQIARDRDAARRSPTEVPSSDSALHAGWVRGARRTLKLRKDALSAAIAARTQADNLLAKSPRPRGALKQWREATASLMEALETMYAPFMPAGRTGGPRPDHDMNLAIRAIRDGAYPDTPAWVKEWKLGLKGVSVEAMRKRASRARRRRR